jgi:SAM-dependent methyltransferase
VREPGTIAQAYSATGQAWQDGPGPIYDRLAAVLVARLSSLDGRLVLDLGAGTGAASRAIQAAGGRPIAIDAAVGMLAVGAAKRPPAVAGDACALPFAAGVFDAVVAAFSLNHITDPVGALREVARVVRPGGSLVVSAYANDDTHPVKEAVEQAARERGWRPADWYGVVCRDAMPRLATAELAGAVATAAGLSADVAAVRVAFPALGPDDLVAWRLGMAQMAPFVAELPAVDREALARRSRELLGHEVPTLVRSLIVLTAAIAPGGEPLRRADPM